MTTEFLTSSAVATTAGTAVGSAAVVTSVPLPAAVIVTLLTMTGTGLITWGMFKKQTEKNEQEIDLLRTSLTDISTTLSDVRERIARIEGKLERD
jgi:hypothetical protein